MRILISNDDGLYGAGLEPIVKVMKKLGEVFVVVPDSQMSATSHSITLHKPIRLIPQKKNFYTVTGTPSDCVRFGIIGILKSKADIIVSGINDGPNLGEDCIYSGTVAAAREGAMLGFPSFAVSLVPNGKGNFELAAEYAYKIIKKVMKFKVPKYSFFNINVPDTKNIKGIALTKMGKRIYDDDIEERTDPRGYKYYWIAGKRLTGYPIKNTDIFAIERKYVSVTPLQVDQTDLSYLKNLKKKNRNFFHPDIKGFTYLEIVLVLAIISYIVITFAQFIMKVTAGEKTSQNLVISSNFAQSKLEQLRATPFYFIGDSSGTFSSSNKKYNWSVDVWFMTEELGRLTVAPMMTDLKMASVSVKWYNSDGEKKYTMSSLFANYGGFGNLGSSVISGWVCSADGSGISNGFVEIPGTIINTYTSYNGNYKLNFVPPGTFTVIASKAGYKTKEICVENIASSENRNNVNFPLSPIE